MLTERDIDLIMQRIQSGKRTYLYYVAHMIEPREGLLDEHIYKSSSDFKVIKIEVTGIQNAYFEYLNYVNDLNKDKHYHTEIEYSYYDCASDQYYANLYTVKNAESSYTKEFNPRIPSIIYGYRRQLLGTKKVLGNDVQYTIKEVSDPSPIKVQYVNSLSYGDYTPSKVTTAFNIGKLDWKYKRLSNKEIVDDIEYQYITSHWYILDIKDFPRVEKPLIHTKQYCAYFRELSDAFNYIDQLKA